MFFFSRNFSENVSNYFDVIIKLDGNHNEQQQQQKENTRTHSLHRMTI